MKMFKLIQNETIKTLKKTSTKILIILGVLALFGAVGFSKLAMTLNNYGTQIIGQNEEWKEDMKSEIASLKANVNSKESGYDEASIAEMKSKLETYELALKYNVNYIYYYNNYWKIEALNQIQNAKYDLIFDKNKEENEKSIDKIIKALENNDYSSYIEILKEAEKAKFDNKVITEEEYNDNIYLLNLRKQYNIYEEDVNIINWKNSLYEDIGAMKRSLRTGINTSTGKLLKLEEVKELEDKLKIAEYRLENDIASLDAVSSGRGMYDAIAPAFSMMIMALLMIIIAGSSISTEISKGTIKFLLFTPNKRWKVLASKIISAIFILLIMTIILSLLSIIIGNIFFEEPGTEYVYISNGNVHSLSNLVFTLIYFLAYCIDVLVYMFFAFMLSTITKNTALSVGVSIACYVGSGIVMNLLNYYIAADWVKFIPFNNLGIADKIFTNNISYSTMQMSSGLMNETSLGFSLGVLGVCTIIMIISMFDSFNKRDIV